MSVTAAPIIELRGVSVSFQDVTVLEDVSLSVARGSFLAILGPNGAGKTTLLRVIMGLVRPTSGGVRVFGKAPWDLNGERRRIGYVPQVPDVDLRFPLRAAQVVLMGRYGRIGLARRPGAVDRKATLRAMERVGITELAQRPLGRLSGGQRQRVFLARALAVVGLFFKELLDAEMADVSGLPASRIYFLLISLIALTVVLSMKVVGIVLVSALIVTPAAAAYQLTENFRTMMALAVVVGVGSAVGGLLLSYPLNTASGATIVLLSTLAFLVAAWFSPRRRRNRQPLPADGDPG